LDRVVHGYCLLPFALTYPALWSVLSLVDREPKTVQIRGRGATANPPNRFEKLAYSPDAYPDEEQPSPRTLYLRDSSRSIIAYNESPDVGFDASINPYRGCEHGCVYCYARPTHEYLGFSSGLDFETRILVKENAPELLREELSSPRWTPQVVAISGVTDPYQPIERQLALTRRCLEVFLEFRNPIMIVTKNQLVSRDIDLLSDLSRHQCAAVFLSVTTLDADLARAMEPRTSTPRNRLAAIQALSDAGIPVGVLAAPVIPGLTDHEITSIIGAAVGAGAKYAGYVVLRLPHSVTELFEDWLATHRPDRKEKVLSRIRQIRAGKLNDPTFHDRMRGGGEFSKMIAAMFEGACRRAGILGRRPDLSTSSFRSPHRRQMALFE
jgi:DNA repair photolyase